MDPRDQDLLERIREEDEDFDEVVAQLVEGGAPEIAAELRRRAADAIAASESSLVATAGRPAVEDALTVEEALALADLRKHSWLLLAHEVREGRRCPIYTCGRCFGQRYTIVTTGARLPIQCPRCGDEKRIAS